MFKDAATDSLVLETEIDIGTQGDTVYLFRLSPEDNVSALKYAKGQESLPRDGYVKVKIANAARLTTADKVDIIFKQTDPITSEEVRVDSILGVARSFPVIYTEIKYLKDAEGYPNTTYTAEIRNSETGVTFTN